MGEHWTQVNRVRGNSAPSARRIVVPWTEDEDNVLRRCYATNGGGEVRACQRLPERTREAVASRASKLRLTRTRWWTSDDLERLKAMWGLEPVEEIARVLRRGRNAVVWRAHKLGLPIGIPPGWESVSAASRRTGYPVPCLRTILAWSEVRVVKQFTRHTKGRIPKCVVEISEVDYAVHEWHQTETEAAAAKRIGWSRIRMLEALKRWGLAPPKRTQSGDKRCHARVLSADVDKAVAAEAKWRTESWSLFEIRSSMHLATQTVMLWLREREGGYEKLSRYQRIPHATLVDLIRDRMPTSHIPHKYRAGIMRVLGRRTRLLAGDPVKGGADKKTDQETA